MYVVLTKGKEIFVGEGFDVERGVILKHPCYPHVSLEIPRENIYLFLEVNEDISSNIRDVIKAIYGRNSTAKKLTPEEYKDIFDKVVGDLQA